MGIPIKDRGINWAESYGDKSASLKEQFEEQVGPGSYFRWEGHDSTSGNDYYVVVSPGFSDKMGYHFFAGLRKMPADDGASGKKFKTQREALSYAYDTWKVPKPETMPAQWNGFSEQDIAGKPIVLGTEKEASTMWRIRKDAMSLRGSGDTQSMWTRRTGPKVLPTSYCWAHKASQSMGFLSALYSNMRFMGVDTMNYPAAGGSSSGINLLRDENSQSKLPMAPMLAKPQMPSEKTFEEAYTKPILQPNKLVTIKRTPGKPPEKINHPQYGNPEDQGYEVVRWRDIPVSPHATVHTKDFLKNRELWKSLASSGATVPEWMNQWLSTGDTSQLEKFDDQVPIQFSIDPRKFASTDDFLATYTNIVDSVGKFGAVTIKGNPSASKNYQKDFLDAIAASQATGQPFDLDEPYFENIPLAQSKRITYTDTGMPVGVMGSGKLANDAQTNAGGNESIDSNLVLDDPAKTVDQYMDYENCWEMGLRSAFAETANTPDPSPEIQQRIIAALEGQDDINFSDISPRSLPTYEQMLKTAVNHYMTDKPESPEAAQQQIAILKQQYAAKQAQAGGARLGTLERQGQEGHIGFMEHHATWDQSKQVANSYYGNNENKARMHAIADFNRVPVGIWLGAFHQLAASNMVKLGADEARVAKTCMPKMSAPVQEVFNVTPQLLPQKEQNGRNVISNENQDGIPLTHGPYSPEYFVRPRKDVDAAGQPVATARWWDEERRSWVYGPVDPDKHKVARYGGFSQDANGQPVKNEHGQPKAAPGMKTMTSSFMLAAGPDGKLHKIKSGEIMLHDPKAEGYMPGGVYDLNAKPSHETPKGTQNANRNKGLLRQGFQLMFEEHYAEENGGRVGVRQHNEQPFIGRDPAEDPEYYAVHDDDGNEVDNLGNYTIAQKDDSGKTEKVLFTHTTPLMAWMKKRFNLEDWMIGAHTGMSSEDLRVIDEMTHEAEQYYKAMSMKRSNQVFQDPDLRGLVFDPNGKALTDNAIKKRLSDPEFKARAEQLAQAKGMTADDLMDAANRSRSLAGASDEERNSLETLSAQWADEPFDAEKYKRGKAFGDCNGAPNKVPKETLEELDNALKNPEQAFQPKKGDLYGLQLFDPAKGQPVIIEGATDDSGFLVKNPADGAVFYFGSKLSADMSRELPRVSNILTDAKNAYGETVQVRSTTIAENEWLVRSYGDKVAAVEEQAIAQGLDPAEAIANIPLTRGQDVMIQGIQKGDVQELESDLKKAFPTKNPSKDEFVDDDGAEFLSTAADPIEDSTDELAEDDEPSIHDQLESHEEAAQKASHPGMRQEIEETIKELAINGATHEEILEWAAGQGMSESAQAILSEMGPSGEVGIPGPGQAPQPVATGPQAPVEPVLPVQQAPANPIQPVQPVQPNQKIPLPGDENNARLQEELKKRTSPRHAQVRDRLIALAARLDSSGRTKESAQVKHVLKTMVNE